jgi:hypothetical protein
MVKLASTIPVTERKKRGDLFQGGEDIPSKFDFINYLLVFKLGFHRIAPALAIIKPWRKDGFYLPPA